MTEVATPRRAARRTPTDLALFSSDVEAALTAFAEDVSYACHMARSAVTISRKRGVWQARRDLKAAERQAHDECRQAAAFTCSATSPCGVGDCKFAHGEMAMLDASAEAGATARPQKSQTPRYSVDSAVDHLIQLRTSQQ